VIDGKLKRVHTSKIGVEKHFYRLRELSTEDAGFFHLFFAHLPPGLRRANEGWLRYLQAPFELRNALAKSGRSNPEIERAIESALSDLEEDLHQSVENDSIAILDELRRGRYAEFETAEGFIKLLHYLCTQYFRTRNMRSRVFEAVGDFPMISIERSWGVLRHVLATNVCSSFVADRLAWKLTFLHATGSGSFLTSDQPVINVLSEPEHSGEPEGLEFYYPVSPTIAVLICPTKDQQRISTTSMSAAEVQRLNARMVGAAERQVFGRSSLDLLPYFPTS
jgi:hypothetical protein